MADPIDIEDMTPGQILADTNVADYIKNLGLGIAEAQTALDLNSLNTAVEMATTRPEFSNRSLIDLGFSPTFYHYQYADLEVNLSITMKVERQEQTHLGFTFGLGTNSNETNQGSGTADITVRYGAGKPASATLRLSEAAIGEVLIGATRVQLVNEDVTAGPNVKIIPYSMRRTALAFASRMSDPPDAVPEILNATVDIIPAGAAITPTTSDASLFKCSANTIEILGRPALPAQAWISVNGPGNINLIDTNVAWASTPSPAEAASAAIDNDRYNALLFFKDGRAVRPPRFKHNSHKLLEDDVEDWGRVDTLLAFLRDNPSVKIRLVGNADQSGHEKANQTLSEKRAIFIRDYLVGQGVVSTQFAEPPRGDGEKNPLVDHVKLGGALEDPENRRVEIVLADVALRNLIRIQTDAAGAAQVWPASRPQVVQGGIVLPNSVKQGADALPVDAVRVTVNDQHFYAGSIPADAQAPNHTWVPGATAESAARGLADAILSGASVDAFAEGRFVRLLPVGSHALIRLETQARNLLANALTLEPGATGSLSIEGNTKFTGGTDGAEPSAGDTVTIGTEVITCSTTAPTGARSFMKGADAASTARSLALTISAMQGLSATATGDKVTVKGAGGTTLATSNAQAFVLSAGQLSSVTPPGGIQRNEKNVTVAVGMSVDVTTSRKYNLDVSGNSRIAARLVSVPAPVELLDEIRTWLNGNPPAPGTPPTPGPIATPTNGAPTNGAP